MLKGKKVGVIGGGKMGGALIGGMLARLSFLRKDSLWLMGTRSSGRK